MGVILTNGSGVPIFLVLLLLGGLAILVEALFERKDK